MSLYNNKIYNILLCDANIGDINQDGPARIWLVLVNIKQSGKMGFCTEEAF